MHQAKTHLSRLLARVEAGEQTVIARGGKRVARLSANMLPTKKREPGTDFAELSSDLDRLLKSARYTANGSVSKPRVPRRKIERNTTLDNRKMKQLGTAVL
jgi:antitoxin (DNA-binding transcriptional repressor) of toxin-antitoxin stability system